MTTGVLCSWLGDRATGFTDQEIVELQRITRELSIALKSRIEHSVAQNIAHAYLGKHAGQAVLNGSIRRGDGEKITAALWYSDLRCSTELADRLSAEAFLQLLGRYFEMTAASVLDHGGEVVSLIGDAVLGLFRIEGAPGEACGRALAAAGEARRRLNTSQPVANNAAFDFGISLHLGQVIYGNVGVPERLQFTLVGSAVNEVVRVQDLTKSLGHPLLATGPFAQAAAGVWQPLGEHRLRGLETPMPILTMAQRLTRKRGSSACDDRLPRPAAWFHSIANALVTIATGLLSAALDSVTRPKLMVRPSRTTRASATTSDAVAARMKCVV